MSCASDVEGIFWALLWLLVVRRDPEEPQNSWEDIYELSDQVFPDEWSPNYRVGPLFDTTWWSSTTPKPVHRYAGAPPKLAPLRLLPAVSTDKYVTAVEQFQHILKQGYVAAETTLSSDITGVLEGDTTIYEEILRTVINPLPRRSNLASLKHLANNPSNI